MHSLTGNLFKEKEEKLPGERVAILKSQSELAPSAAAAKIGVSLPAASSNSDWTQPGGDAANAPQHLAFAGSLHEVWTADAGAGSSSEGQLTPRPIAYGGKVFTLDTHGQVRAFAASSGSALWNARLTPENEEKDEGYGGGLAVDEGRLFVTTGYGTVVALEPASGNIIWTKNLNVPIRTSPTAFQGKVFAVTTEGRIFCLSATDGEEVWTQRGLPDQTSILGNNSPAASDKIVVVPFSSGDVTAYDIKTGQQLWSDSLANTRTNSIISAVANPARPVISNGVVYAISNSGRMIATSQKNGERLWNLAISSTQAPWPAGNMVYVIDSLGRAVALARDDGGVVWVKQLGEGESWTGPLLAGDRLWFASERGKVVGLDPKTGQIATQKDIDYRIHIAPIVAAGHMYILTDNAKLVALN